MSTIVDSLRVKQFDLTGIIAAQREWIRTKAYQCPLGRLTELRLGVDKNAEYFRGEAWTRVSRTSKLMGLTLSWTKADAPWVAFAPDRNSLLLIGGIPKPPKCAIRELRLLKLDMQSKDLPPGLKWKGSQLVADEKSGIHAKQSILDYASGRLHGRDGSDLVYLCPIEQAIVLANARSSTFNSTGTLLNITGMASFDGRHPSLLWNPRSSGGTHEAYIVGGMFQFADH